MTKQTETKLPKAGDKIEAQDGVTYVIEDIDSVDDHLAKNRPNVAAAMRESGQVASMSLRRPKGKKMYYGWLYKSGACYVIPISFK